MFWKNGLLLSFVCFLQLWCKVTGEYVWPPAMLMENMKPVFEFCLTQYPVDSDILSKARAGQLTDDEMLKGFMLCNFEHLKMIDHDTGEIFYYKLLDLLPDAESKRFAFELAKECLRVHEPRAVNTAYKFIECVGTKGSAFSFL